MESELFNGEYFHQNIRREHVRENYLDQVKTRELLVTGSTDGG